MERGASSTGPVERGAAPAQLLTSGQYTLTPRQLATTSLPAVNARGTVAVTIDRAASTLRMRWTHTDGTAYDETWRMRP